MAIERGSESPQQGIQSVEVGARVLAALENGIGPMALSEVAKRSDMHPAKTHRYLVSLVRTGLASQDALTGLYDLGPAARHLGIEALRRTEPIRIISAAAADLRDETGHTINIAVWADSGPIIVRYDGGEYLLPIVARVGSTLPMLDSAVGYVFLAYLPASATNAVIRHQQSLDETRKAPAKEIAEIKEAVRREGFASTRNHMIFGLAAMAAPIFGADGAVEAVVGVVMPVRAFNAREQKRLAPILLAHATRISGELGHRP